MSRTMLGLILALSTSYGLSAGASASEWLDGEAIKARISGKRVYLSTALGVEIPLRYGNDGTVSGSVKGISAAKLLAPKESGRWWIESNKLCQQFPTWYKGKRFCFLIKDLAEGQIGWTRDDQFSGTARIGNVSD